MADAQRYLTKLCLLLATLPIILGIEKHWLPDLEWQTKSNWIGGLLPDADSRVIFPEDTWHTVGLPNTGKLQVAEIYLPREGSLSLGRNGILMLSGSKKKLKNVQWAKKGIYMWIDPDNWDGYTSATPHAERIPCDNDIVVLPSKQRALSLALPTTDVHVQAVRIADEKKTLDRWQWKQLSSGMREFFETRLTVTYAPSVLQICNDCTCHSGQDDTVAEEVCNYMWQAQRCGVAACESPLKVEGNCCDYCGGRVTLSNKASLRKIEGWVNKALENYRDVVSWHIRKMWDGNTEVLVAEKGAYNGINSQEAIDILSDVLIGQGNVVAEKRTSGNARTDSSLSVILGPMLGIPLILVLLMLAAIPYFGYSYSQVTSGWREVLSSVRVAGAPDAAPKSRAFFGFARFENVAEGDVRIDEDALPAIEESLDVEDDDLDCPGSSKRFENPLYRSKREITTEKPIAEEKMIDIDAPVRLNVLESRIREETATEEVALDE